MTKDFTDQTVLVTGATSGVGMATAQSFAARGATVVATGRNQDRGAEVVKRIREAGGTARFLPADLSSPAGALELLTALHATHIDVLVNNAGATPMVITDQVTDELFQQVFAVNVRSPMALVAGLAPAMAARGRGSIVNLTSLAADRGLAIMGLYGASKAALAAEFGPAGIRVNAISPALIKTEGTAHIAEIQAQNAARSPSRGTAGPSDAAEVIVFLASPAARHIHGAIVAVDGGSLAT